MSSRKKMFSLLVVALLLSSLLPVLAATPAQACNPGISLSKTGPDTADAGEAITYSFTVTNNGDIALSNVSVSDGMLRMVHAVGSLAPGAQQSFTKSYTIPAGAIGNINNTASAVGNYNHDRDCGTVRATDSHTVRINVYQQPPQVNPNIDLAKTGPASATVGETITYNFTVTNSGDTPLSNVTVTDAMLGGVIYGPVSLTAGQASSFSKTYTVKPGDPDALTNTASAIGYCTELPVTDEASWTVDIFRPDPGISLEKTGPGSVKAGETITYTFTVTNTGNVPLADVTVKDKKLNLTRYLGTLPAGDAGVSTFTATYKTGPCENGPVYNEASVKGKYGCETVEDNSKWTVEIIKPRPGIQIIKSGPETACVGDCVTYTFTVNNTGDVPLSNVVVTDARIGLIKCLGSIPAGGSETFTRSYKVLPWDPCLIVNTALVTACSPCGMVTDTDCHKMVVGKPSIDIEKCGPIAACAGDTITYKFIVKNTGNVPLADVTVTDPKLDLTRNLGTLAPCQTLCFTADYQVKPEDACLLTNIAMVTGESRCGTVKDRDVHKLLVKNPVIEIEKNGPETACRGDKITYRIKIKNTGNMPLMGIVVEDPTLDWKEKLCPLVILWPGQTMCFKVDYVVGMEDPDPLVNTATVNACSLCCGKVTAQDDHVVDILNPAVEIEKTGPESACVGHEVGYQFKVTNTGDTDLTNLVVTDDVIGDIGTIEVLGAGESTTLEATYTITGEDPDPLVNTATVTACTPCQEEITDTDDHSLEVLNPVVEIIKTGPESATVGDEITYEFEVKNTGDTPLIDLVVTDDVIGDIGTIDFLDVGESKTLQAVYAVQEDDPNPLVNTATVTGMTRCEEEVTDSDDHSLVIIPKKEVGLGGVEVTKTLNDSDGKVTVGDTFTYDIQVTNTGNTFIPANVNLKDTYDTEYLSYKFAGPESDDNVDDGEIAWTDISGGKGLNPGESVSVTVYFVAMKEGEVENNAAVSAADENGAILEDSDSAPVTVEKPALDYKQPVQNTPPLAQATPAATTTTTSSLPYTGDNLGLLIIMALSMMAAGPLFMATETFRRRKREK
ncbi:MAG: DUF11 domain-containing protein [Actinobacteria bacterium]|nr:DUF11 domain-containing protein [Actinomycetota bacterium]